jgi:tetrahydromethanopterin S-methyltransferase subunit G
MIIILENLIAVSVVIIVIPSLVTIVFRLVLYQYLRGLAREVQRLIQNQSQGLQTNKVISTLERRFKLASNQLDQVNTSALIDQVYSQQKLKGLSLDQIDYFCRIIPNLLLAFGLIGTFVGITFNLYTLSQTLNQTNAADINALVEDLKQPLAGMSIAFVTSLLGLFFSALLTIVNFKFNTSALKYHVLSALEDYLDNIYLPQVQGDNRLDKIVKKMVSQQDEFLTRFGDTVRTAVETSMAKVAQQIAEGNQEVTDLARQVYERFTEAAGTISGAADKLESSIHEFTATSQIFKESAEIFTDSHFPDKLLTASNSLTQIQENFSESAANLTNATQSLELFVIEVKELGEEIKVVNQNSSQVLELHQVNQTSLSEIIPQLQQGANSFRKAVTRLDKLEHNIIDKAESLQVIAVNLSELKTILDYQTTSINSTLTNVSQDILDKAESLQVITVNLAELKTTLDQQAAIINSTFTSISQQSDGNHQNLLKLIANGNSNLTKEYRNIGNVLLKGMSKQTTVNQDNLQNINKNLQHCIQYLNETKYEINQWRRTKNTLHSQPQDTIKDSFTHT